MDAVSPRRKRIVASFAVGIICLVGAVLTVRFIWQSREPDQITPEKAYPPSEESIAEIVNALAELSLLEWQNDANLLKTRVPELYKTLLARRAPILEESLWLYRVECLMHLGKDEDARPIVEKQLEKGTDKPDFLVLQLRFVGGDSETLEDRIRIWNEHGRIVPLSLWGRGRDSRLGGRTWAKVNPPPPSVPKTSDIQVILAEVAELYEQEGYLGEALNVYLETFYTGFPFATRAARARLWVKAAEIERTRGNKELAVRAYLRAVRVWHGYAKDAEKGIRETLVEGKPAKTIDGKARLPKDVAIRIASLYRKLNLHPMALAALERAEKSRGADLTAEKQAIQNEWDDILHRITRVRGPDCYVLGQKVSQVKDWATIPILRPTETFWKS